MYKYLLPLLIMGGSIIGTPDEAHAFICDGRLTTNTSVSDGNLTPTLGFNFTIGKNACAAHEAQLNRQLEEARQAAERTRQITIETTLKELSIQEEQQALLRSQLQTQRQELELQQTQLRTLELSKKLQETDLRLAEQERSNRQNLLREFNDAQQACVQSQNTNICGYADHLSRQLYKGITGEDTAPTELEDYGLPPAGEPVEEVNTTNGPVVGLHRFTKGIKQ